MAVGAVAVGALAAASNNNRSSGVSSGLLPLPSISNISEDRKKPKKPDASSNDSDSSKDIPDVDVEDLPENAQEAFKKYDKAGWKGNVSGQTEGTNAGGNWENKKDQLPKTDEEGNPITYKEYDVNNYNGETRDKERFVRGSDGSVYYTDSHYGDRESKHRYPPFVRLR